jgi:phage tail sheath protein FI
MPSYLTPGVYVEEVPSASKPIEGVGTSVAAFVGLAPGGPLNTPVQCSNWTQFARTFGDPTRDDGSPYMKGAYLAYAVAGFFDNGGSMCWVVRVGGHPDGARQVALPAAGEQGGDSLQAVARADAEEPVAVELSEESDDDEESANGNGGPKTYKVVVTSGKQDPEEFTGLTMAPGPQNVVTTVNAQSKYVRLEEINAALPDLRQPPAAGEYSLAKANGGPVTAGDVAGDVSRRTGLDGLSAIDEITMLCVPDLMAFAADNDDVLKDLQGKMIAACENAGDRMAILDHCELMGDRMAILDAPPGLKPQEVKEWRVNTARYDSKFATLYYPWIEVLDPSSQPVMVPPCGHVAGLWARTDTSRGVHKAPANEVVRRANGLGFQVTAGEQAALNRNGVNCIRAFPGRGIRVWGARTLSSDPEWRYINVRRLVNFISESIMEGTQWAVFEPNDSRLWMQLRISTGNFLTRVWRDGALFGSSPDQAFYVKCDAETNPPDLIEAGQVTTEIGIAPVKPAEFIVFRISQFQVGAGEGA